MKTYIMYLEHIWFHRLRLWRWRWTDVGHGAVCRADETPACRHGGRAVETVCRRGQAHRGVEAEKNYGLSRLFELLDDSLYYLMSISPFTFTNAMSTKNLRDLSIVFGWATILTTSNTFFTTSRQDVL